MTSPVPQLVEMSFDDPLRKNEACRPAQFGDTRRAYFYLLFVLLAFFGIGEGRVQGNVGMWLLSLPRSSNDA